MPVILPLDRRRARYMAVLVLLLRCQRPQPHQRYRRRQQLPFFFLLQTAPSLFFTSAEDVKTGYLAPESFCRRQLVITNAIYLTCDSPSAYYYGSQTYRNSVVCMSGDKVSFTAEFVISSRWTEGDAIYMQIEFGLYDHLSTVLELTSLCSVENVKLMSVPSSYSYDKSANGGDDNNEAEEEQNNNDSVDGDACPIPGATYVLKTYYTLPRIRDYSFHYTPDVKITFVDENNRKLGCSTTGTVALHHQADVHAAHGLLALGISLAVFMGIFGMLLFLSYRRKKRLEKLSKSYQNSLYNHGSSSEQKYHYFRTLPNGTVVPLSSSAPPSRVPSSVAESSDDGSSSNGGNNNRGGIMMATTTTALPVDSLDISNPSYNETHMPITRPII